MIPGCDDGYIRRWYFFCADVKIIEDALRAKYRRPRLMGPAFACLVEKLQKIAQETFVFFFSESKNMVGGKPATYSQEPKLAQKRKARGQNLTEEGNLEAKMPSKIH